MAHRGPQQRTLRYAAALRELASLGLYAAQAARLLGVSDEWIYALRRRFDIDMTRGPIGGPRDDEAHRLIEESFAAGLHPREIAELVGYTEGSISVILCRKGLRYSKGPSDPAVLRRGYAIPDELRPRYKELRKLGLTTAECGYELGLLERPKLGVPA